MASRGGMNGNPRRISISIDVRIKRLLEPSPDEQYADRLIEMRLQLLADRVAQGLGELATQALSEPKATAP